MGYEDRKATPQEMNQMKGLVNHAMQGGAFGVASALIYPPGIFADTNELIELAKIAAKYDGMYISHLRSEGFQFLEAFDEFLTITKEANIRSEIYHLKASGEMNWSKLDEVITKIKKAREEGLNITTDMYTYTAGATGLDSLIPPWVHEGGHKALIDRLRNPILREQIKQEIIDPSNTSWENQYLETGPEKILLVKYHSIIQ